MNLVGHMRWADSLVADALEKDAADNLETSRLFAHIAAVEHVWYARIQGRPAEHEVWPSLGPAQARLLAAEHADLLERLVVEADDDALGRVVQYRNSAGRDYSNSVGEIVTHVAMHGSHHRGQIARLLRASGHEPAYVDYIQFLRRDQER